MPERELLSATPVDQLPDDQHTPAGYLQVELSEDERTRLEGWIKSHLSQIETAMQDVLSRFEQEVDQLEGRMPGGDYPYPGAFRLNVPITKKKVREVANRLKQAYLDSDPIWAIASPTLPAKLTQEIERAMDHQVDNHLDLVDDVAQALFEAVLHGVGAVEAGWNYWEDIRRDLETYHGFDGVDPKSLMDLIRFEATHPNWRTEPEELKLHTQIAKGEDVRVEVKYSTATINRPDVVHIPVKDLRLYPHLNSMDDLLKSPCYGYVKRYTRLELEELADNGTIDPEQLIRIFPEKNDESETTAREEMDEVEVFRGTIRYQLGADTEPTRYKIWYERKSGAILRCREFPWWLDKPDLVLFHTRQEEPGVFKRGIAWDLVDTAVAANVTFGLYLNGADMANSMRWLTKKDSLAEQHLLNRRWSPHLPMVWEHDPKEVQSLQTSTAHLNSLVTGFELVNRQADWETQTTNLQSGRESPNDPTAPAAKTAMLLQQVEPNTKEYLRSLESGFRQLGQWVLWLYYQGKRMGWIETIPGWPDDLPDELVPVLAAQLQPRALLMEADRQTRLQADNMVLGWVSKLAPQAVPMVLKKAISHVSPDWAKEVDTLPLEPQPQMMPGQPGAPAGNPGAAPPPGQAPVNGNGNGRLTGMLNGV